MKMFLMLDEPHPGLPEFGARYKFSCYIGNEKIESYACKLTSRFPQVKIYGFDVVVPYSIRKSEDSIMIYASYTMDNAVSCAYELKFARLDLDVFDDFEGNKLDSSIWGQGWPWGVRINKRLNSAMLGDLLRVEDSHLIMPCAKMRKRAADFDGEKHTISYASSCINTLNRLHVKYGCVMINVEMHTLGGVMFAAWLAQINEGYFLLHPLDPERSKSGELGFLEYAPCWGERYAICTHYYCDGKYSRADNLWYNAKGIATGHNTFGVVRLKNGIFYYYNGELVSSNKGIASTSTSELCLLMATSFGSSDGVHYGGNFSDDMLPIETKIDWVKIYSDREKEGE